MIPFVSGRKMPIGWWFEDVLVRLGLGKRIWHDVGVVNPWDPPKALPPDPKTRAVAGRPATA